MFKIFRPQVFFLGKKKKYTKGEIDKIVEERLKTVKENIELEYMLKSMHRENNTDIRTSKLYIQKDDGRVEVGFLTGKLHDPK